MTQQRSWVLPVVALAAVTLVLAMLVSCGGASWVGYRMQRAQENRDRAAAAEDAVVAIEKLGGEVTVEYEELRRQTWLEKKFDDPGSADDPVGVLTVSGVNLFGAGATDADLEHIVPLTSLKKLELYHTHVTDAGLERLKGLTSLEFLDLSATNITDAGLEHLKGMTKLFYLDLSNTNVTDEGVKKLQQALPNCEIQR